MHYLEIGLLSLPVIWGLAYCVRDLRRRQNSSIAAKPNSQNNPAAQGSWMNSISEVGSVDIGTLDPKIEHAVSEGAHAGAVDIGQAIERIGEHIGHWLHH